MAAAACEWGSGGNGREESVEVGCERAVASVVAVVAAVIPPKGLGR